MPTTKKLDSKKQEMKNSYNLQINAKDELKEFETNFEATKNELIEKSAHLEERENNLVEFKAHHNEEISKINQMIAKETEKERELKEIISTLKKEIVSEKAKSENLKNELVELQKYTDFVQNTVNHCHSFDTIELYLGHYSSIKKARGEYLLKYQELVEKYNREKKERKINEERKQSYAVDRTIKFKNALHELSTEKQQSEYRKMELLRGIQRIRDKTTEVAGIKSSLDDLYRKVMSRVDANGLTKSTDEQKLQAIKNRFSDLTEIVNASLIEENELP